MRLGRQISAGGVPMLFPVLPARRGHGVEGAVKGIMVNSCNACCRSYKLLLRRLSGEVSRWSAYQAGCNVMYGFKLLELAKAALIPRQVEIIPSN